MCLSYLFHLHFVSLYQAKTDFLLLGLLFLRGREEQVQSKIQNNSNIHATMRKDAFCFIPPYKKPANFQNIDPLAPNTHGGARCSGLSFSVLLPSVESKRKCQKTPLDNGKHISSSKKLSDSTLSDRSSPTTHVCTHITLSKANLSKKNAQTIVRIHDILSGILLKTKSFRKRRARRSA